MKETNSSTNQQKMSVFKQIREKTNMSQGELAHLLGVSNTAVSRWETGVNEPMLSFKQFKILSYILRGMGVSVSDLPDDAFGNIQGLELPVKKQESTAKENGNELDEDFTSSDNNIAA